MSDKANQILSDYKPSQWMHDESLPDYIWENLVLHDDQEGEVVKFIKVKSEQEDKQDSEL